MLVSSEYRMNSPGSSEQHLFLQPLWDYVLTEYGDIVSSPLFPVALAFCGFLCFSFPFAVIDILGERCPLFYQYKIQKNKHPTVKMMVLCIWKAVFNHVFYVFPTVFFNYLWMPPQPLPVNAPTVYTLLGQVLGCLLLFDFQYFIWHVFHHKNLWLYKKFHAVHHNYVAPFSWSSQNLSGYELMTVGFWSTMNPIQLGCHPLAIWTCNLLSIWMSVDDHIGYNFPWSLNQIVPYGLYGGVLAHDLHHQRPDTNFAPFFGHWDLICGTSYSMIESD